jgi:hypothetical protein
MSGTLSTVLQLLSVNGIVIPIQTVVYLAAVTLMDDPTNFKRVAAVIKQQFMPIMYTTWKYFPAIQVRAQQDALYLHPDFICLVHILQPRSSLDAVIPRL